MAKARFRGRDVKVSNKAAKALYGKKKGLGPAAFKKTIKGYAAGAAAARGKRYAPGTKFTPKRGHVLWLHDDYPDDFALLCAHFPYARAVVKRREFYGNETAA